MLRAAAFALTPTVNIYRSFEHYAKAFVLRSLCTLLLLALCLSFRTTVSRAQEVIKLVTSGTAGLAMKSEPLMIGGRKFHSPGTLIGKALEPLARGTGVILVLLSLQ